MPETPPNLATDQPMEPAQGNTGMATVPPTNAGMQQKGIVLANLGMTFLLQAATALPSQSEERVVVLDALAKLAKKFQGASKDLTQQEAKLAMANANPAPTTSPEQQLAMKQQMNTQRLSQMQPAMAGAR